jgi:hypothetical protein
MAVDGRISWIAAQENWMHLENWLIARTGEFENAAGSADGVEKLDAESGASLWLNICSKPNSIPFH